MAAEIVKPITLEAEYKKKTGVTPEDIRKLRAWLDTQPHLPADYITDLDLILTFHCCNKSAEVAKQVLDMNLTLKTLFTNIFKERLVTDKLMKIMSYYLFAPLDTRAYDDSKIIYCRLLEYDPKLFVFPEAVKCVLMVIELWQYLEGTWPGFMIVIDLEKVTLTHITKLDIQTVQQFLYFIQEALLVKLKGLHYLNAPSFMDRLMMIIRPFMKKELLDVLSIHETGSKTLDKFIPPEALPKDVGGQFMDFDNLRAEIISTLRVHADYFVAEQKKRVTESLRPGKSKTITDIFGGIEGSFKKLDID